MKNRYYMESTDKKHFIEGEFHEPGLRELKRIRKSDPRFKRARIKTVIQAYPSKVPLYTVINRI